MSQARGAIKWAIYMLALLVVGPLAAAPLAALRDASGGHEATILVNTSPLRGLLAALVPLAASTILGLLAARLIGPRHGLVTTGLVLAWAAWRSASIDGLMRATRDHAAMIPLAGEGALLGLIGIIVGAAIWVAGADPDRDRLTGPPARRADHVSVGGMPGAVGRLLSASIGTSGPVTITAGLLAAGIVTWLVAVEPLKGQTIAACMVAGIAAGGFGRAAAPRDSAMTPIPGLIAMATLAAAGPLSALVMTGGSNVVAAAIGHRLFPLAMPMPFDWLAGAFWGIPLGLSWAESMIEKQAA